MLFFGQSSTSCNDLKQPRQRLGFSSGYLWDYLRTNGLMFLADALGFVTAVMIAFLITYWLIGYENHSEPIKTISLMGSLVFVAFLFFDLYPATGVDAFSEFKRISVATTLAFVSYILVTLHFFDPVSSPKIELLLIWLLSQSLILAFRSLSRPFFAKYLNWGYPSVLIGDHENVIKILPLLATGKHWTRVIKVLEHSKDLDEALQNAQNQDFHWAVVVGDRRNLSESTRKLINRFANLVMIAPIVDGGRSSLTFQSPSGIVPVVQSKNRLLIPPYQLIKRVSDIILALVLGLALMPIALLIALSIWRSSPGPVLYCQQRIGRGGHPFRIWKFRTMVTDADKRLQDYFTAHPELREEWEKNQKLLYDPRITKIGHMLRTSSLDELPQLWNVLIGEMSFVGPRPIVMDEKRRYGKSFDLYQQVAPGITGLWQISGRNTTSYSFRIALDDFYVRNWSLWLDFYIILCTIKVVLRKEGAC